MKLRIATRACLRVTTRRPSGLLDIALLSVLGALALPAALPAQEWECLGTTACDASGPNPPSNTFTLRLMVAPGVGLPNIPVVVTASSGTLRIHNPPAESPGMWLTDANGVISGWVESPEPRATASVRGQVNGTWLPPRVVRLAAAPAPRLTYPAAGVVIGFAGTNLRETVVTADLAGAECQRAVVRFTPRVGTVSVDSAFGAEVAGRCEFRTQWRLGEQLGPQVLQARLGSAPPVLIAANARRRPAIRVGLLGSLALSERHVLDTPPARVVRVAVETGTDTVIRRDSIVEPSTVRTLGRDVEALPMIMVDMPVPMLLGYTGLRLNAGTSATRFGKDLYLGLGLMQGRMGTAIEELGFDIHAGVLFSRRSNLENPGACRLALEQAAGLATACTEAETRHWGLGFGAAVDAQALIGSVGRMLGF